MYHLEYIPIPHDRSKRQKGNGSEVGRQPGHVISNLNDDGCFHHGIISCERCPLTDCDYDKTTEYRIIYEVKRMIKIVTLENELAFQAAYDYLHFFKLKHPVIIEHIAKEELLNNPIKIASR